ncbi:MAG: isochorismatase family protein, partial [Rhodobacterales bacterium]
AGLETLVFGGIVTNGGVASTVRDAHVRDFHNIVLSDGCAAFSQSAHEASITSLSTIAQIATCDDLLLRLKG